ncbi:MAG: adenine deaminase [Thermoplasmata archaeon]|nr:MAG: adenine deaminase [Thermoplasmata archaeon]
MREELVEAALGERAADLVVRADLLNVHTGEIVEDVEVAVYRGYVVHVGDCSVHVGDGTEVLDARGLTIVPGLLDAHAHFESSMLTLTEYAKAVAPHGTTSVFLDPHEIVNVLGPDVIGFLLEESEGLPVRVFLEVPSCVPASPGFETSGGRVGPEDVARWVAVEGVVALAEVMDFQRVLRGDGAIMAEIDEALRAGRVVEGHCPGLLGRELSAYAVAGVSSDHEATTAREALERLRAGMWLEVREGSVSKNLSELLGAVLQYGLDTRHCVLATDDVSPLDLERVGHMDHLVRRAVEEGVDPVRAVQMATINTAERFGLSGIVGSVSPGRFADMVLVEDLERFRVRKVLVGGRVVAEDGVLKVDVPRPEYPGYMRETVRVPELSPEDFLVRAPVEEGVVRVRVIGVVEGSPRTEHRVLELEVRGGFVPPCPEMDVAKVSVIERHRATGRMSVGFVQGFGIERGALASTVGHDAHNLTVVGVDEGDMALAVRELKECGGGFAVACGGELRALVRLPIAGLVSDKPLREVCRELEEALGEAWRLGVRLERPFMTMSFLPLTAIPELRITDMGLVDAVEKRFVPLFVEGQ